MASFVYNRGKLIMSDGTTTWSSTTIGILLTTSSYTPNVDHNTVSEVTNELSGGSYARKTLGSKTVTEDDTNDRVEFDGGDITWTSLGAAAGTPKYVVVYDDTGTSDATKELIAYLDLGTAPAPNGGDYTVNFDSTGLFRLDNA